jgi:hypothetical protein
MPENTNKMTGLLLGLALASSPAQPGLSTLSGPVLPIMVSMDTSDGKVLVYLPSQVAAGDRIAGSTFIQAAGSGYDEQHRHFLALEECSVTVGDARVKIGNSMFSTLIPAGAGSLPMSVLDPSGRLIAQAQIPVSANAPAGPSEFSTAPIVQAGTPIVISGPFDGNRMETFASINGRAAGILAEGPRECDVTAPGDKNGPVQVRVSENGRRFEQKVSVVGFTFMAPANATRAGSKAAIAVEVDGLQDADPAAFPVAVQLWNSDPRVMRFPGPNPSIYTLRINRSDVSNGHALASVPIQAKGRGQYTVTGVIYCGRER